LRPLMISLLPEGAFKTYELRQKAAGVDITQIKPAHIEPSPDTIDFLTKTTTSVRVHGEATVKVQ
jgi:hypothetical protein